MIRPLPGAFAAATRSLVGSWASTTATLVRQSAAAGQRIGQALVRGVRAVGATNWSGLASGMVASLQPVATTARAVFARIGEYGRALGPLLVGATRPLLPAWQAVSQRVGAISQAMSTRVASAWDRIRARWDAVRGRLQTAWGAVESRAGSVAQRVSEKWSAVSGAIGARVEAAKQAINAKWIDVQVMAIRTTARVAGAWQRLPQWVRGPLTRVAVMAGEDAGRIGSAIGGAFRAAVPVAARAWQSIRSVAGSATTALQVAFPADYARRSPACRPPGFAPSPSCGRPDYPRPPGLGVRSAASAAVSSEWAAACSGPYPR